MVEKLATNSVSSLGCSGYERVSEYAAWKKTLARTSIIPGHVKIAWRHVCVQKSDNCRVLVPSTHLARSGAHIARRSVHYRVRCRLPPHCVPVRLKRDCVGLSHLSQGPLA